MSCNKQITQREEISNNEIRNSTPEPSKLTNDEKASVMVTVIDTLLQSGLPNMNLTIACGIGGNIKKESSFNYTLIGDNGTSYGLCQWHDPDRWTKLKDYCKSIGISPNTPEGQTKFLIHELQDSKSSVYNTISSPDYRNDIDKVATYFCKYFEIPANRNTVCPKRAKLARTVLGQYKELKGQQ